VGALVPVGTLVVEALVAFFLEASICHQEPN
jgi:hypothetical protein